MARHTTTRLVHTSTEYLIIKNNAVVCRERRLGYNLQIYNSRIPSGIGTSSSIKGTFVVQKRQESVSELMFEAGGDGSR